MNNKISAFLITACLLASAPSFAEMNDVDKQYVEQLIKGGSSTLRQISENMVNTGYKNPEVLDVLAEVLIEKYPLSGGDFSSVDSVAWMCRALGASNNTRYRPLLEHISDDKALHRKLRGHCSKAMKQLPKGSENAYAAGTVNLELLRNPPPPPPPPAPAGKGKKNAKAAKAAAAPAAAKPAAAAAPAPAAAAATPAGGAVDLSKVAVGMSQQQVNDLLGPPTAQTQRMTGKQWQPFNFGAKDLQRLMYLYKGVGRVEFSLKSAYEGVFRVVAVTPDANESGYP
jgi:hypothetical protein